MPIKSYLATNIAGYFLGTCDQEAGDNVTHLKLQKLLYYAQGFHLAMNEGECLFDEPILAWDHGPVVESIWHQFKGFGYNAIDPPTTFTRDDYPPELQELLDAVNTTYGQFTAKRLESMTHDEPPWASTPKDGIISIESIRAYFATLVEAGRESAEIPGHPSWPTNSFLFQRRKSISRRMDRHRETLREIAGHRPADFNPWDGEQNPFGS